ncbi:hypothetical protein [Candidatus Hodarchaeum mangrovi]
MKKMKKMKKRTLKDMNIRIPPVYTNVITIILTAEDIRDMKALVKDIESSPKAGGMPYTRGWYMLIKDLSDDTEVEFTESILSEAFILATYEDMRYGEPRYTNKPWFKKFSTLFDWEDAM